MIWPRIKEIIVKEKIPGSFGYQRELLKAIDIFLIVIEESTGSEKEINLFNADKEVTEALLNRNQITTILDGV